jgi:hypothetical protein
MVAFGVDADGQFFGDLPVDLASRHEPKYFHFPLGQSVGIFRGPDRSV